MNFLRCFQVCLPVGVTLWDTGVKGQKERPDFEKPGRYSHLVYVSQIIHRECSLSPES